MKRIFSLLCLGDCLKRICYLLYMLPSFLHSNFYCTLHHHFDRKVRFTEERGVPRMREHRSVLDDPSWLSYYPGNRVSDESPYEVTYLLTVLM